MATRLITAATFPQLETRLVLDIEQAARVGRLGPSWVVVPNATLANHLRVRLAHAAAGGVLCGVRVVSLPRLAERLAERLLGRRTPAWHPLLDLTLMELVGQLPANSPLAPLREINNGPALLRPTFTDLAEGGFGVADLGKVEDLAAEPDLGARERAVLQLFAAWVRLLDKRGIEWAPLVLQRLPQRIADATDNELAAKVFGAEAGQTPQLYSYGFYEWLDVHLEWLAALAARMPLTLYYPWHGSRTEPHPAFSFTTSVLEDLRIRLAPLTEEHLGEPTAPPARFFLATFPDGSTATPPPQFLTWQSASGIRAEAISAAVRIRQWLDDPAEPLAPEDILIVAPAAAEYVEAVTDVFRAFAIPLRVSDVPTGPAPETEPLRVLGRLWAEQAPAEWLLAYLRAWPTAPVARGVDVDQFEAKIRALGLWGGATWRTALQRRSFTAGQDDGGTRTIRFNKAEQGLLEEILAFVPAEAEPTAPMQVAGAEAMLRRLAQRWVPDPAVLMPLVEAVRAAATHRPKLSLPVRQWAELLAAGVVAQQRRDPLVRAVSLVPLMRARGLTARAVVILGLAAGQIPPVIPDDPVLSDGAVAKLAGVARAIGHRLPLRGQASEEMLLLFFLINTAAERIHWVVPETDAAGKAVAPTPWVQRYRQRWVDGATDRAQRRVPRSPLLQGMYLAELEPVAGALLPPAWAVVLDPALAQRRALAVADAGLLAAVAARETDMQWNGALGGMPKFRDGTIHVTKLEALARCPFRFYVEAVACWEPLEPLTLSHALDPTTRGTLLHRLLEQAIQPHLKQRPVAEIAAGLLAGGGHALRQVAAQLAESDSDAALALALLPPLFRQAALAEVIEMALAYCKWAQQQKETAVPQQTEAPVRQPFPGLAGLELAGKIDRLDASSDGPVLTDYKSGKRPNDYSRTVKLGWQIQAALYPWLCAAPHAQFRYVYLGGDEINIGDAKGAPAASELLAELAPVLTSGAFIPTSNQALADLEVEAKSCQYCKFASACRRFERGAAARCARWFAQLLPARLATLQAVAAPKNKAGAEAE